MAACRRRCAAASACLWSSAFGRPECSADIASRDACSRVSAAQSTDGMLSSHTQHWMQSAARAVKLALHQGQLLLPPQTHRRVVLAGVRAAHLLARGAQVGGVQVRRRHLGTGLVAHLQPLVPGRLALQRTQQGHGSDMAVLPPVDYARLCNWGASGRLRGSGTNLEFGANGGSQVRVLLPASLLRQADLCTRLLRDPAPLVPGRLACAARLAGHHLRGKRMMQVTGGALCCQCALQQQPTPLCVLVRSPPHPVWPLLTEVLPAVWSWGRRRRWRCRCRCHCRCDPSGSVQAVQAEVCPLWLSAPSTRRRKGLRKSAVLAVGASAADNLRRGCLLDYNRLHRVRHNSVHRVHMICIYTVQACSAPVLAYWLRCSIPGQWSSAILSVALLKRERYCAGSSSTLVPEICACISQSRWCVQSRFGTLAVWNIWNIWKCDHYHWR